MEIRQIDQNEKMLMETNVKMLHVPSHYDLDGGDIADIIFGWAMGIQELDFKNVSVYNLNITFIGKYSEKNDDK